MTITSLHNQKLKEIRKLRQRRRWRERSGRFVAEGEDLLAAADAAGWQAVERYSVSGSGLAGTEIDADLLAAASGLASGTRTLAVYEERWASAATGPLCVYLHGVHDPGNVGTILRSAEAFAAASVVLGPRCADPFGLKAVRASMGAVFAVPLVRDVDVGRLPGLRIALVPGQGVPLDEVLAFSSAMRQEMPTLRDRGDRDPGDRDRGDRDRGDRDPGDRDPGDRDPDHLTLMIGAERTGLPPELVAEADITAHIPIQTDSLNAAMAATIALYELRSRMAPR